MVKPSNSSQRCSMRLRSRLCAGQSSSSTPISTNHFCMDLALCMRAFSCWNRKVPSPNCCHKVGSTETSRMSMYAVALRFPFPGTEGSNPNHYSSSTKMLQLALCIGTDLSVGLPDGEGWFITPENTFPLLQSPMAASFAPLQPTREWVLQPRTDDFYVLRASTFGGSVLWACGLPLCGWAIVAPRHFHFTITAYTVDWAVPAGHTFYELTCWKGGIQWRLMAHNNGWNGIKHMETKCLSMEIVWLCARFYTPVSNGCGWNSRIY